MLIINHLTKHYKGGSKGVTDLSLHVMPGDICAFIGHNGAGKTTTLKCIAGIHGYDAGEIRIGGISLHDDPLVCKQMTAYIPDNPDLFGDLISSYSHGMKQKLAIISALLHEPRLLVLDEPFVGLDPKASVILKERMRKLCAGGGAIFFSTHVLEVAEKLCNKVAMIKEGRLIAEGTMEEVVKQGNTLESIFMEVVNNAGAD